ncbi:MAG TPA: A/G-specific adenine glycosylase [Longimicrobiales bacterium]|nr:A/G-specific adenine glycosylase [Longimicrobiales bacterium]
MTIQAALLQHYDRHRRDLPWRTETDPYRIWVSEVMLQQTRVETVIPYYRRWLERFPDVDRLAAADLDDVLLAWQGLGYYRRARNLHAGAAVVRERHGGSVPGSYQALRALPGVGEYTAGAVASIAFGEAVPAVDGNVKRVLARLYDQPSPGVAWLRRTAGELVDRRRPGDWNQALMELGATVCTPAGPDCGACPVARWCRARAAGTQAERPAPARKKEVPARSFVVAVVVDAAGRALVVRRPHQGLLAGMWAFPDVALEDGEDRHASAASALEGVAVRVGPGAWPRDLPDVRHRFTHLDATYQPVLLAGEGSDAEDRRWIPLAEPWPVALPVAQQKIARSAAAALDDT